MTTPDTPEPSLRPGEGLLGANWGADRRRVVALLAGAYARIADGRDENFAYWLVARDEIQRRLALNFENAGLEAPPLAAVDLMDRAAPEAALRDSNEHIAFVKALMTDATPLLWDHIEYRMTTDGNVHLEIIGGTGSGKSSCAITIADGIQRIAPERLLDHVNFDLGELQAKLKTKKARETVVQDEFLQTSGEGARTTQALFQNLEDTLRASQVNLIVCSPRVHEHATMQARLEAIAWNPAQKWSAFLLYTHDRPKGVVAIPWCREELWNVYSTFKKQNVSRSLSGAFQDKTWLVRTALRFFDDAELVDYLKTMVKGRQFKRADFEEAISVFHGDMMTVTQREKVASFMQRMTAAYKRAAPKFERYFGLPPNDGLRTLAGRAEKTKQKEEAGEEDDADEPEDGSERPGEAIG